MRKLNQTIRRHLTTQGFACEVELVGPRRFAMALAALCSAVTGLLFYWHLDKPGLPAGVSMALAASTVATTQFCAGWWIWHRLGLARSSGAR